MKELAGKYGKVSREGLYSGALLGRFGGGYLGFEASDALIEDPDLLQLYPVIDSGSAGPEELVIYSSIVAGYFLGGALTAKGVTKFQELRKKDFRYTRPVNNSIEKIEEIASSDNLEEEKADFDEAVKHFFEDED